VTTLHVLAFPHTQTTSRFLTCAYTQKAVRFCPMMAQLGWRVVLYGGDENEAQGCEHVPLFTEAERLEWFGPAIHQGDFSRVTFDSGSRPWRIFNARCAAEVLARSQPRDFLLMLGGLAQKPVADALPELLPVEYGIGYEGVWAPQRVYESYAWLHYLWGKLGVQDGRWYDDVIPNYFDPDDFEDPALGHVQKGRAPGYGSIEGDYLLFVGRCIARKGVTVAGQVAERAGLPLVVAGFGARWQDGILLDDAGGEIGPEGRVKYVGPVDPAGRAALLAGARALLAPTLYIEPFGGVAVEAMLSGTPAVTTDWGAFTETVEPGRTGERFRTLQEGVLAVERAAALDPLSIRERAVERFAMANVGPRYSRLLERLETLWGVGWAA
jgi:glycosyltransferase involved in cell wall biosynthesis